MVRFYLRMCSREHLSYAQPRYPPESRRATQTRRGPSAKLKLISAEHYERTSGVTHFAY